MKRIIAFVLSFLLVVLCACGKDKKPATKVPAAEIEHEVGYSGNAAYLPYEEGEFTSPYDDEANKLRNKILNLKDSKHKGERTYYISYKGNDGNDGLSPEKAWKTTAKIGIVPANSVVLFERGGVYRTKTIKIKSGCTYAAYGEGAKPCLYGSLKNYADESLWKDDGDGIWTLKLDIPSDVGAITFDHGKKAAQRVYNRQALVKDYQFIYSKNGTIYLKLSEGNPAKLYSDIEITCLGAILDGVSNIENVTIENLCIKYSNFGISGGANSKNLTIRGCEIGYIGGCTTEDGVVRWGNGIEIWGNAWNSTVENNWIYQCYDAGLTHQCTEATVFENVKYTDNLLEFNQYNLELWNAKGGKFKDFIITGNICRFAGYQVYDPKVRHGSDSSHTSHICGSWSPVYDSENYVVENNIFDTSYGYIIKGDQMNTGKYMTVRNNKYCQQIGLKTYFYTEADRYPMKPSVVKIGNTVYTALTKEQFEKGVALIDTSPAEVIFYTK